MAMSSRAIALLAEQYRLVLAKCRSGVKDRPCAIDVLEDRRLMAVSVTLNSSAWTVTADASAQSAGGTLAIGRYDTSTYCLTWEGIRVGPTFGTEYTKFVMIGSGKADTIIGYGYGRADIRVQISGGAGNDSIQGSLGADTIDGGDGDDTLWGFDGADSMVGGAGGDYMDGGANGDTLTGLAGRDTILGQNGHDLIKGSGDDDRIIGGAGNDTLDGGLGVNTVSFADIAQVSVNLLTHQATSNGQTDTLSGFQNIDGSPGNDSITGDGGNNVLYGGEGGDTLIGGGGSDTYSFADANAFQEDIVVELSGTAGGTDILDFWNVTTGVRVNLGTTTTTLASMGNRYVRLQSAGHAANFENVKGGKGNDWIAGNAAGNEILGGSGSDTINGGAGADSLAGGGGGDSLNGGDGNDSLYGDGDTDTVTVDGNDTIWGGSGADSVWGEAGNDSINGDSGSDYLDGGVGNDTIRGGGENDSLVGHDGSDQLYGDAGNDLLVGDLNTSSPGAGNDYLNGGDGNDTLRGGVGADTLDGGSGIDVADYLNDNWRTSGKGVLVSVNGVKDAGEEDNVYVTIEEVWGTNLSDTLAGGTAAVTLFGAGGNDSLTGGTGADYLDGGVGADTLNDGGGNDVIYARDNTADVINGGPGTDLADYDGLLDKVSNLEGSLRVAKDLTATAQTDGRVELNWTDASDNESGFKVQRSADNTNWTTLTTTAADATRYKDPALLSAGTYYYRVCATNSSGDSAFANVSFVNDGAILARWQFEEGAGTSAADASGHGYDATLTEAQWDDAGVSGRALILPTGAGSAVSGITWTPDSFTVSFWIKPLALGSGNSQRIEAVNGWNGFGFCVTSSGGVYAGIGVSDTSRFSPVELPGGTVVAGVWQQFAFSFTRKVGQASGTGKFYKNGVLLASKSGMSGPAAWTGFQVRQLNGGSIDELRIYNHVLSDADVQNAWATAG